MRSFPVVPSPNQVIDRRISEAYPGGKTNTAHEDRQGGALPDSTCRSNHGALDPADLGRSSRLPFCARGSGVMAEKKN
jgi:hypothetical protein